MTDQRLSEDRVSHTPGPWWIHREYSTLYIEGKARDPRVFQEVAAIGPKEGGGEQQVADAMLIVAAPDLLEALNLIATEADSMDWAQIRQIARSAIDKAKGRV